MTTAAGPGSKFGERAPLASVIIPIYNGAATIGRALQSIFAQTFTDFEIVCVDDGSTDDTASVLAAFGNKIRIVKQSNRGFPGARNAGVAASRGQLLALIDHDDQWMPRKLELSVAAIDADTAAALVFTDLVVVNETGEESRPSPIGADTAHAPTMEEMLSRIWPIMPSTVLMRRSAFDRAGAFAENLKEDLDFWLRIREQGNFIYLPDKLIRFTFGQLYPKVLNRDIGPTQMIDAVRARYGARADGWVRDFIQHKVRMIAHAGVVEMSRGNMPAARQCFIQVLRYDRLHIKTYLRLARTFLPESARRALSGRAARGA
jgi:glycosyltransferase involved in cell wall biosynthesis